jgi:PD-(D/E)XK nuclease superfamily
MSDNEIKKHTEQKIKQLSYSSLLTLHRCPREFQLDKNTIRQELTEEEINTSSNITLNFGTVMGDGIQELLAGSPLEKVKFNSFLKWNPLLTSEDAKKNKSLWSALFALDTFSHIRESGFLEDWEVVLYKGKPACELSFRIHLPNDYKYRGHVDVVLVNKKTKQLLVLEIKTTGYDQVNPATYKNSAQAIGYSIVLDAIAPELSSYTVLYLIHKTKSNSFMPLEFPKSYSERARWIAELSLDVELLSLYEEKQLYPIHGESCIRYNRECQYYGVCTLSDSRLFTESHKNDEHVYDIEITLNDLISSQIKKESKPRLEDQDILL